MTTHDTPITVATIQAPTPGDRTASPNLKVMAPVFDERDPAVKQLIAQVIAVSRQRGRKTGIYGQAPSDDPDFAQFLVEQGIDRIPLKPDTVLKTTLAILEKEKALKK